MEELVRLRDRYDDFQAAGVDIAVASTDTRERSSYAAKKYKLPFDVFSDDQELLLNALGIRHANQGPKRADVFYATSYLVDRRGQVVWAFASPQVNERVSPEQILQAAVRSGQSGN